MSGADRILIAQAVTRLQEQLYHELMPLPLNGRQVRQIADAAADFVQQQINEAFEERLADAVQ